MKKEYQKEQYLEEQLGKKEKSLNISEIWYKILEKWYLFVITLIITLIIAILINKYSVPKYEASTTMLIKTNNDVLNNLDIENGLMWSNSEKDFQNAINILQSYSITKATLRNMNLYCSYYQKLNIRDVDIYKDCPFEIMVDLNTPQPTNVRVGVRLLNEKQCSISYNEKQNVPMYDYMNNEALDRTVNIEKRNTVINYDEWYKKDGMRFKVLLKKEKWSPKFAYIDYAFNMNNFEQMAYAYNHVNITRTDDGSSIIKLSFIHENPQMSMDFVNMLCKMYIDQSFTEKKYLNVTTIDFVNQQLSSIGDSLNKAESMKESFQSSNNTLNLTNDGQYLYQKTNELQQRRAEAYTKQQYYDYLEKYINSAGIDEGIASPAVMGVEDPVLIKLVSELSDIIIQHKTSLSKGSDKNPRVKELELKIHAIRKQLAESLRNLQTVSRISQKELQRQQNDLQNAINLLPSTERNMVNIQRQFKFNDEIYSFLYQKRAEAEIAKNAALPDHRVIDKAISAKKVYPKTVKNLIIAFIVGLLVPVIYIVAKYLFKDTLDSKDDIKEVTDDTILGYIPSFPKGYNPMMVFSKPRSQITEAYRAIRTNLKYELDKKDEANGVKSENAGGRLILVTSSMPNEGKTLTSMNVASVFSISGQKTLLMEYDLRKPRLHKSLGLRDDVGITTYYIGRNNVDEIIQHTEFENLDVVCVGQVPPNPSEIVDSDKNRELLTELRKRYDCIILDTPPVNIIADAQTLAKDVDIVLYIVRSGITSISIFKTSLQELKERSDVPVGIIFNGIQSHIQKYGYKTYSGNSYGYGYYSKYGYSTYGYGYFDEDLRDKDKKKRQKRERRKQANKRLKSLVGE
ncbi:MAG: polysaccharide biosynthesis tyrosine autokinase [Bacteroidales bacterium]|nr:polysaccharide biosynthesis tyrosine autokinase [Bacteroidales bacterium]